ncbi:unnamed protein product [Gadus morhua 'NCC']
MERAKEGFSATISTVFIVTKVMKHQDEATLKHQAEGENYNGPMRGSDANQEFVSSGAECQPVKDGVRRQRPRAAGRNRVLGSQDRASGTRQHGHHGPLPVVVPDSHRYTGGTPTGDCRDRDRPDRISRPSLQLYYVSLLLVSPRRSARYREGGGLREEVPGGGLREGNWEGGGLRETWEKVRGGGGGTGVGPAVSDPPCRTPRPRIYLGLKAVVATVACVCVWITEFRAHARACACDDEPWSAEES